MKSILILVFSTITLTASAQKRNPRNKAIFLEDISWTKAREVLTQETVVVIPLGAGAKEHGPHLPLSTDFIQAEGVKERIALERKVVIAPTINYGFYPAFIKYAGSTTLSFTSSTEMILQVVRSLSNYGPKRFYIINIGISTTGTLESAARILAAEGILLYYSDYTRHNFEIQDEKIRTKELSGHADELETSSVLALRSDLVDMTKAVNDSGAAGKKGMILSPLETATTAFSASGIVGYAALATKQKGLLTLDAFSKEITKEIDSISTCALPLVKDNAGFLEYTGEYEAKGRKKLLIMYDEKMLQFKMGDAKFLVPFPLYRNADDFFSALTLDILFVRDLSGNITKAWCRSRGESFWMDKLKKNE